MKRAKFICATGGGKTLIEYNVVRDSFFKRGEKLVVLVAPTIALLNQHHKTFDAFGMFGVDNVSVIHFRTGIEARKAKDEGVVDYAQTTNSETLFNELKSRDGKNTLVFVTYASEKKLLDAFRESGIITDTIVYDEFHHCCVQSIEQKEHLLTLPTSRALFFSASEKRGRIVSSTDETLFGEKLCDVTYKQLRDRAILVPSLQIKLIRVNAEHGRVKAIKKSLEVSAKREGFDAGSVALEAAAIIVARKELLSRYGRCNLVTFSKTVGDCKRIHVDAAVKDYVNGCDLQVVYAGTPGDDREKIFDIVKNSNDSVLLQHSIVKEGIDVTAFNALIFSRKMEVIGVQQALGRIVRADPEDTKKFESGELSLDDPKGWKKYYATAYVIVDDDDMADFERFVTDLYEKLAGCGLSTDDYQFVDITEERVSNEVDDGDDTFGMVEHIDIGVHIHDLVKRLEIVIEAVIEKDERARLARVMSPVKRWQRVFEYAK